MNSRIGRVLLFVPTLATAILVFLTVRHHDWNEAFFVNSAYYALFALLGIYAGVCAFGPWDVRGLQRAVRENAPGLAVTATVATVVFNTVAASYRVLADEANLVGVSKNLFFYRTANFAVTGKWYFENYWNLNEATDRRPALFPFLVHLVHLVRGYRAENAFTLNAILFVVFVFLSYRLAKCFGGELYGLTAAILVATSPNTLVGVRSAGFDFLFTFVLLVVVQCFYDYARAPSSRRLVTLTLALCLLPYVRYECWALMFVAAVILVVVARPKASEFREYAVVYALLPLLVVPRYWQAVAKANDAEQPLSASLFSVRWLRENAGEYFRIALHPLDLSGPHSPLLLILGLAGLLFAAFALRRAWTRDAGLSQQGKVALFIAALILAESVICFSYMWGKPLQPAAVRLFIWLDTFVAFAAAWPIAVVARCFAAPIAILDRRSGAPTALIVASVLFAMHLPTASDARFINALILTRDAAQEWQFFQKVGEKQILILCDRPGLFTIMNYGALDISTAVADREALVELSRSLYKDIYLIQEIDLETHQPNAGFASWSDVPLETQVEFQSTDTASIRISRVKH